MKKSLVWFSLVLFFVTLVECSGKFWAGTGAGILGAGGGYELHLSNEKKRIKEDLDAGKITQDEYNIRLDQIRRDSLLQ